MGLINLIKKGFMILNDGKELVTYDGVDNNVDLDFNLARFWIKKKFESISKFAPAFNWSPKEGYNKVGCFAGNREDLLCNERL